MTLVAICHRCGGRHEANWPGTRPKYCVRCTVVILLRWRFDEPVTTAVM